MSTPQNSCDAATRVSQRDTDVVRARSFRRPRRWALMAALVVVSLLGAGASGKARWCVTSSRSICRGQNQVLRSSSRTALPIANRLSYHKARQYALVGLSRSTYYYHQQEESAEQNGGASL